MSYSRREFIGVTAALMASPRPLMTSWPSDSPSPFHWHRLRDDAWMISGAGGNVTVLGNRLGAIVIDAKSEGFGPLLRADIEARVGPVVALIVTHHHTDHAGGAYYGFEGVRSFAHSALTPRLVARQPAIISAIKTDAAKWADDQLKSLERDFGVRPSNDVRLVVDDYVRRVRAGALQAWAPSRSVGDSHTVTIGGTRLEFRHIGPGHTDNDLFVIDRTRNLIATGDLLFHQHHPYIDVGAGATTVGWQTSLRNVIAACDANTVVVPGHGPAAEKSALDEQSGYFDLLRSRVGHAIRVGKDRAQIVKLDSAMAGRPGFPELHSENLGVLFDELTPRTNPAPARY
jgi:cyclase